MFAVIARRPTATTQQPPSAVFSAPLSSYVTVTFSPPLMPVTLALLITVTFLRLSTLVESILTMSASTPGSMLGIISITVTGFPREANNVANSMPITPPPIITKLSGSSVIESTSSEVMTFSPSMPGIGGRAGALPVARISLSNVIFSPSTSRVCSSTSFPKPFMTFTPCAFSSPAMPLRRPATTESLYSASFAKSNPTSPVVTPQDAAFSAD